MEAVTAAAVLMLVVLGVLAALDAVSRTAGANKARTVAATLAEEDQERLRGMRTLDIDQMPLGDRQVDVSGVVYTVNSRAEWVQDASGETVSCATEQGQTSYMRITSTVTSPVTGDAVKPVVLSSIVAPTAGAGSRGTLAVKVKNAHGLPVMNLPVQATGPMTRVETTNSEGCAVFGLLDPGTYTVKLDQAGWVDKGGNQLVTKDATVTSGNLSTLDFDYDKAATLRVEIVTKVQGSAASKFDAGTGVIAANTGVPPSGFRLFPDVAPAPPVQTHDLVRLFPFPDGYTVFAGRCTSADPSEFVPGYFDDYPGFVILQPGLPGGTIEILEPPVNVHVRRNGSIWHGDTSNSHVYAYPKSEGCGEEPLDMGLVIHGGKAQLPGLPFGTYDICVQDTTPPRDQEDHVIVPGVVNGDPKGINEVKADLDPSKNNRRCPGIP